MSDRTNIDEYFWGQEVSPKQMDFLWAQGWRHFGVYFFRYARVAKSDGCFHVMPLRINLSNFRLSTSQKRVLKKNQDLRCEIQDATIDDEKAALFDRHKTRFSENVPDSIYDFFTPEPASIPCHAKEICLYLDDRLLAVSFLDVGAFATSSVYAIFEPTETKRSLGTYLILRSISHSLECGMKYYYPGYAYREPSHYDYKKRFSGLEFFDWQEWQAFTTT